MVRAACEVLCVVALALAGAHCGDGPTGPADSSAPPAGAAGQGLPTATTPTGITVKNAQLVGTFRYPDAQDIEWSIYEGEADRLSEPGVTLFCRAFPPQASAQCTGVPPGSNAIFIGIKGGSPNGAVAYSGPTYDLDQGCRVSAGTTTRATSVRHHEWGHVYQIVSGRVNRVEEEAHCFGAEITRWAVGGLGNTAIVPALNHLWEVFDSAPRVVYMYTGNRFNQFSCGPLPGGGNQACPNPQAGLTSYSPNDSVSFTLIVNRRLPANISRLPLCLALGSPCRYDLRAFDGHQVLTMSDRSDAPVAFTTDGNGDIIAPWQVGIFGSTSATPAISSLINRIGGVGADSDSAFLGPNDFGRILDRPGTWRRTQPATSSR
jgi:hypothetical protein